MIKQTLVLAIIISAVVVGGALAGSLLLPRLRNESPTAGVFSSASIIQSVKPLGQLTSVRVQMAKADILVELQYGVGNVCHIWANHVSQGTVEAGIDLNGIGSEDISFDAATETYRLALPAAQLTGCSLDPVATQQYTSGGMTPLCPANTDEMRRLASYEALIDFRDDAVAGGILEQAETESEIVLTNFIRALTGKNVAIEFHEAAAPVIPQSCAPEPPGAWQFDDKQNRWIR